MAAELGLLDLPLELQTKIVSLLPVQEHITLHHTCKQLWGVTGDVEFWRGEIARHCGVNIEGVPPNSDTISKDSTSNDTTSNFSLSPSNVIPTFSLSPSNVIPTFILLYKYRKLLNKTYNGTLTRRGYSGHFAQVVYNTSRGRIEAYNCNYSNSDYSNGKNCRDLPTVLKQLMFTVAVEWETHGTVCRGYKMVEEGDSPGVSEVDSKYRTLEIAQKGKQMVIEHCYQSEDGKSPYLDEKYDCILQHPGQTLPADKYVTFSNFLKPGIFHYSGSLVILHYSDRTAYGETIEFRLTDLSREWGNGGSEYLVASFSNLDQIPALDSLPDIANNTGLTYKYEGEFTASYYEPGYPMVRNTVVKMYVRDGNTVTMEKSKDYPFTTFHRVNDVIYGRN